MADQDEPGCTEAIFAQTIPGMLVTDQDGHGIGTGGSLIKAGLGSVWHGKRILVVKGELLENIQRLRWQRMMNLALKFWHE